eukprot:sb/3477175/
MDRRRRSSKSEDHPRPKQRSSKIAREAEYRKKGRVDTPRPLGTQLTRDRLSASGRSFLSISSENLLRSSRETILSDQSSDSRISATSDVMRRREKKAKMLGKASCYVFDW